MWLRRPDRNTVENLLTGFTFAVRLVKDNREAITGWEVVSTSLTRVPPNVVIQTGYATEAEATAALDEFLSAQDIIPVAFQPPVTTEEIEEKEVTD